MIPRAARAQIANAVEITKSVAPTISVQTEANSSVCHLRPTAKTDATALPATTNGKARIEDRCFTSRQSVPLYTAPATHTTRTTNQQSGIHPEDAVDVLAE